MHSYLKFYINLGTLKLIFLWKIEHIDNWCHEFINAFADAYTVLHDIIVYIYYESNHLANGILISTSCLLTVYDPVFRHDDNRVFQIKYGNKDRPNLLEEVSTAGTFIPHRYYDGSYTFMNNIGFLKVSTFIESVRVQTLISWFYWPANFDFFDANKITPSVSEWIFHAEHESRFKNFPSRRVFKKIGVATPKNGVSSHSWKIEELNHGVLQTSIIWEIKGWNKPFQMSHMPN